MSKFSRDDFHVAYHTYQTLDFKMIEIQIHILDDHLKTDSVLYVEETLITSPRNYF